MNSESQIKKRTLTPKVLLSLDAARIQWYHLKAIIIAGMGLFTDAYDLFCIAPIMKMISHIYYHGDSITTAVLSLSYAIALLGTATGQLVFGYLGDRVGRRRVYGICLIIMILSSFGCGFSVCTSRRSCVMVSLGFFRFILGLGIGGDYPLSATIMSEFSNKRTRGAFIAAVFSMQGLGILVSSAVTMAVCVAFKNFGSGSKADGEAPVEADVAWRLILMIGALPAALTLYWRVLMPETARYTALVEHNIVQAAKDMQKVMSISNISDETTTEPPSPSPPPTYKLFSIRFLRLHGRDLFAASANWFLVDVVFYTSNFLLSHIFSSYSHNPSSSATTNVYDATFEVAKLGAIIAACSTIPGYWFTVFFIDKVGRVRIQIMGFFFMAVIFLAAGIPYCWYWSKHEQTKKGFMVLYGFVFFFCNFGPNTTTFIIPAELFPARFRSTCHGISGAAGKLGAIVGTVGFFWATKKVEDGDDINQVYPDANRMRTAFLILGGVCIAGMFVTYFFTKETMGRSLEENEHEHERDKNVEDEEIGDGQSLAST
ncbi:PREDICTED: probable inorganic phosphate transporter 1-8 [Brassica oleracea var. oleracea]|uniref:Major facilitator superfamily (MFS) profile domain-containing protein n=2 Tax=Brassica oleracea var. oleracea TaxID=109376 RepID=A0A0D3CBW6_BRAOL|nr:PREDICTED: probable inorganic phosphate transporter 1-8 [Brassica oleracea var. oleracea]